MAFYLGQMPPQQQEMQRPLVALPPAAAASAEDDYVPYEPLPDKFYDVTNPVESLVMCICFPCNGYMTKSLLLQDQEATLKVHGLCNTSKQKRPYAQIGSVDIHRTPCGCARVTSNLTPPTSANDQEKNGPPGIAPGLCGCDTAMVEAIAADLQERKKLRGGIGQIRKLDYVLAKAAKLGTLAPMLAHILGIRAEPKPMPTHEKQPLPVRAMDVTNVFEKCHCTSRMLLLTEEEAELRLANCAGVCGSINSKREYGELGFVEKQKSCVCCFSVASDISPIVERSRMVPGCPCANRATVGQIVQELRGRMAQRGQVGQIRKQEKILRMVAGMDESLRQVVGHMGLQFPPAPEEMQRRFGSQLPELGDPVPPPEVLPRKTYDTTSKLDSIMGCVGTCGLAGLTQEQVVLDADDMYVFTKNNLDDSSTKIPYADMDSVDIEKTCCCCWSVNGQSPGWGCDSATVNKLAADLQERKEKRGNIAQLKQLRSMQATAVGLNVMADMALKQLGLEVPTSDGERRAIWGNNLPRGLTMRSDPPHIEVTEEFESVMHNVTNIPMALGYLASSCCLRGWHSQTLELDGEEMSVVETDCCTRLQSRTPYGNLGSVETETQLRCVTMLPDIAVPGCGCSGDLVQQIADQLQERKVKRGNIAQMKQQENIIVEILKLEVKMDVLAHAKQLKYPPSPDVVQNVFAPPVVAAPPVLEMA